MGRVLVVLIGLLSVASSGCAWDWAGGVRGNGDVERVEREVSGFSGVAVENQGDLFIELGDEPKLVVEAEANLLQYITTEVRGRTLHIGTKGADGGLRNTEPIRYYLTAVELDSLRVSSAGDIEAPEIRADRFSIRVTSAGDVKVEALYADELEVTISSAGDVIIEGGEVDEQEITISSAGDYKAADLASDFADVRISSAGDARIRVKDRLEASLSSSGDLIVFGDPEAQVRTSSSGEVTYRD